MNIYQKILAIRKELPPFQFDRTAGDVKIISDEQMNKALVPLLDKYNIITIPHGEIIGDHFKLTVEFRSVKNLTEVFNPDAPEEIDDRFEAHMSWPIDKRNFEFGATATLADKYLSVILFKIKGELKNVDSARAVAFTVDPLLVGVEENPEVKKTLQDIKDSNDIANQVSEMLEKKVEVFDGMASTVIVDDPLKALVDQVTKDEELKPVDPIVKPEKKEPEPSEALMNKINEGNWKLQIPLHKCTDEITATKALNAMYMNVGTGLYGHLDNELCPVNPYKVIDQMARRSNLKIRRPIVQYRVYGEEAFWNQLEAETNLKKEDILAKLASPKNEVVKEETKKIIHELKLDFEIPEHMGVDRDEETTFALLQNLLRIGVTKFTIIYALGKMKEKPQIDATDDDTIILQFLSKGSLLQIEEMVKLAKGAG